MNYAKTYHTYKQLPVSSERTFPAAPFPRKYIHSVLDDLRHAVQAVYELRIAGYDPGDIHVMASWDYVEAIERKQQQQSLLVKAFKRFYTFMDEGFGDVYLHEARQGRHILLVRLCSLEQTEHVRDLLTSHHAHLIKYVDTWTVADLLPSPAYEVW
jgi:hypothetical protein